MKIRQVNKNLIITTFVLVFMLGAIFVPSFYVWGQLTNHSGGDEDLNQLYTEISDKKKEIGGIEAQISKFKSAIRDKQNQKSTLYNQVGILDDQISKTELEVEKIKTQINQINLEIQVNEANIETTTEKISKIRQQMAEFIRTISMRDDKTYLEVLVVYKSLTEFFVDSFYP